MKKRKINEVDRVLYECQKDAFKECELPKSLNSIVEVEFDDKNCQVILKLKKNKKTNKKTH